MALLQLIAVALLIPFAVVDAAPWKWKPTQISVLFPEVVVNGSLYYKAHLANGELLTTNQTAIQPTVTAKYVSRNKLYTLITSDPDAPTPQNPIRADILHWLAINLPAAKVSEGQVLQPYRGPGPPAGSPPHRYIFRLFEQPGRLDAAAPATNYTTVSFDTFAFAERNNLKLVATTHFLAQRNA